MEELRILIGKSIATSLIIGLIFATLIPLTFVPMTRFMKRHKNSIKHNERMKVDKPDDYIFVVIRTIVLPGAATGIFLNIAANHKNILWSNADATPATLIKTFIGMFLIRELVSYWSHRLFHYSKLLYKVRGRIPCGITSFCCIAKHSQYTYTQ